MLQSHRRSYGEVVRFESLEPRKLLSASLPNQPLFDLAAHDASQLTPLIVAGDPNGTPADSPALRVDPNTVSSPFAGVGSVYMETSRGGYIGSAAAISPTHILTAGHNVDIDSNGVVDVATNAFRFILNAGGSFTDQIFAKAIYLHPDYTGFANPVVNDDIAVIELERPLPAGTPIYSLYETPFTQVEDITMVGYGTAGDAVNGYYINPEFDVKRVGWQQADAVEYDDEGSGSAEVFEFDMDGGGYNRFGGGSLGNNVESHIGGGDSGGPSFVTNADGSYSIFGVNTYSYGYTGTAAPKFGSAGGGMVVSAYSSWINGILGGGTGGGGGGGGGDTNAAPVANDDSATANKRGRASLNVLANDTDPDGDALSVTTFTQPANGSVTMTTSGDVSYRANSGFSGVDTFTYEVSDGVLTGTATVSITVGGSGGGSGGGGKGPKGSRLAPVEFGPRQSLFAEGSTLTPLFTDSLDADDRDAVEFDA